MKDVLGFVLFGLVLALVAIIFWGRRRPDQQVANDLAVENARLTELVETIQQDAYNHLELIAAERRGSGTSEENLARIIIDEIRSSRSNRKGLR
jgi:hypothetical protein